MNRLKYLKIIGLSLFLIFSINLQAQQSLNTTNQAVLEIAVENISQVQGEFFIAIYNSPEGFREPENAIQKKKVTVNSKDQIIRFQNLSKGKYAIAVFQDWNGNNKLDVNWLGVPVEPYGFSNNPKIMFGPPDFNQSAFFVSKQLQRINIELK